MQKECILQVSCVPKHCNTLQSPAKHTAIPLAVMVFDHPTAPPPTQYHIVSRFCPFRCFWWLWLNNEHWTSYMQLLHTCLHVDPTHFSYSVRATMLFCLLATNTPFYVACSVTLSWDSLPTCLARLIKLSIASDTVLARMVWEGGWMWPAAWYINVSSDTCARKGRWDTVSKGISSPPGPLHGGVTMQSFIPSAHSTEAEQTCNAMGRRTNSIDLVCTLAPKSLAVLSLRDFASIALLQWAVHAHRSSQYSKLDTQIRNWKREICGRSCASIDRPP